MGKLLTREQYLDWINRAKDDMSDRGLLPEWSQLVYQCECGGGMCKNLLTCRALVSNPPITEYEYRCDKCGKTEYLRG